MDYTVITYSLYLVIALGVTIWVARTLHHSGRVFLVDCFRGNEELADSVNHLLVVGFYLVNVGFVTLFLKVAFPVETPTGVFEALSGKIGTVLLVLGGMHFWNIWLFNKLRKRTVIEDAPPPVAPTTDVFSR
ncbi:MAG: hypothetical protein ACI8XO_000323 [Verrucomicrobiales bacterium]|jgi:hypothetical protein